MSEKNIPYKTVNQEFWKKDAQLAKLNPMMTVPFIKADGKLSLVGSQTIVEYFEELYPDNNRLMPIGLEEKAEVRRVVSWFDEKFYNEVVKHVLGEKIFKFLKSGQEANQKILNFARANMPYNLKYLEFLLKKRGYIGGNMFTVADITVAAQLSSLDYLGEVDWSSYPVLKEWYGIIKSRPSFKQILNDKISGFKASKHYSQIDF